MNYSEAVDISKKMIEPLLRHKSVTLPTDLCLGKRLSKSVYAPTAFPRWPLAAMDGYAIDFENPGRYQSISTGEAVLEPYDTVIPIEHVALRETLCIHAPYLQGQHVRPEGEIAHEGDLLLNEGTLLTSRDLALAAGAGLKTLPVDQPATLGILMTGDEIQPLDQYDQDAKDVQIVDTNHLFIRSFLQRWGFEMGPVLHVKDQKSQLVAALETLSKACDGIVISGGTSKGERDHVQRIIASQGPLNVNRVAMKPGKPFKMGQFNGKPIFLLPGFPVAAYHVMNHLLEDALCQLTGRRELPVFVALSQDFISSEAIDEFVLVKEVFDDTNWAEASKPCPMPKVERLPKGSGNVRLLSASLGFIHSPAGHGGYLAGDVVALRPHRL